ncbi:hypothetical protein PGB90_009168 [Kerria lacca]
MKTGLLIGTNPKNIGNLFKQLIQNERLSTLYIQLLTEMKLEALMLNQDKNMYTNKNVFRKTVFDYYSTLKNIDVDVRVLLPNFKNVNLLKVITKKPIEVVYFDSTYSSSAIKNFVQTYVVNKSPNCRTISFFANNDEYNFSFSENKEESVHNFEEYDYVVLGGTFDKLHIAHKIMLSEAVMRCRKRLTVGVTTESLLQSKILPDLIEDCDIRIKILNDFLNDIESNIEYNIVPIDDMYGPTKTDPTLEMIVVSTETIKGAEKVNEYRENTGLSKLNVISIDIIKSVKESDNEENKISSSNLRMRMLGTLLRPPVPRLNIPSRPYIIGLTGNIASGKSSISNHLQKFGCGYVNCDELGHKIYEMGSEGYNFIKDHFGLNVLNEDGSVNRKQLGTIVFSDQQQLQKLNSILWPIILKNVKERITVLHSNEDVVVIEAALLIQANWVEECHELWACIIPPNEAVKRLQNRDNLSVEEAQTRIRSQLKNKEIVSKANVIFCTLWDENYTKKQVEKAWCQLQERLSFTNSSL